jgi:hypothetical protein
MHLSIPTVEYFYDELEKISASKGFLRKYLSAAEAGSLTRIAKFKPGSNHPEYKLEPLVHRVEAIAKKKGLSDNVRRLLLNHFQGKSTAHTRTSVARSLPPSHEAFVIRGNPRLYSGIHVAPKGTKPAVLRGDDVEGHMQLLSKYRVAGKELKDIKPRPPGVPPLPERATDAAFALKGTPRNIKVRERGSLWKGWRDR